MKQQLKKDLIEHLEDFHNLLISTERINRNEELIRQLKSELPYFTVSCVAKEDLLDCLTEEQVALVDDWDMEQIADKMGNAHTENGGYWIDLDIIAKCVLKEKIGELKEDEEYE
jgi:hypothetical protein